MSTAPENRPENKPKAADNAEPENKSENTPDPILSAHPHAIFLALDKHFGDDPWLSWDPETVTLSVRGDVSERALDKVLAVHAAAANASEALRNAVAFEKIVTAFCNNAVVPDTFQPPYVEELCYAVRQLRKILASAHPDDGERAVFGDEVPGYVAAVAKFRGWFALPGVLSFAQDALNALTGLQEGSALRAEHEGLVATVERIYKSLDEKSAEAMLKSPEIAKLSDDESAAANLTKMLIGALLYDPTLLYSANK